MKRIIIPLLMFVPTVHAKCGDKEVYLSDELIKIEYSRPWEEDSSQILAHINAPKHYKDTEIKELQIRKDNPFIIELDMAFRDGDAGLVDAYIHVSEKEMHNIKVSAIYTSKECFYREYVIERELEYNKSLKAQPSAAGTSPTGAASQHSAGGSAP